MSVDRGALVSAADSCAAARATGMDTVGVWSVTTADCKEHSAAAYAQPKPENPAHAYVSFKHLPLGAYGLPSENQSKILARRLARKAVQAHPAPPQDAPDGDASSSPPHLGEPCRVIEM